MKRIGIMGGTFDPVHNGHLLLGRQARSEYGLDEIWYMPSHIPPHKKDHRITDGKDRLAMLELALEGIPFFSVSDFEMKREGNTYTARKNTRRTNFILSLEPIPCSSWKPGITRKRSWSLPHFWCPAGNMTGPAGPWTSRSVI